MQEYTKVNLTDLVRDAILKLDSTTQSLASSFSGTLFPTNNVVVGMIFYNLTNNLLYVCTAISDTGTPTWEEIGEATCSEISATDIQKICDVLG